MPDSAQCKKFTVGSIDVERGLVKPLKDPILAKKRNKLSDVEANALYYRTDRWEFQSLHERK